MCNTRDLFDVDGDISLIIQDDRDLSGVIPIYGAVRDHDTMVGGHATPTGYETKVALKELDVHASVNFLCLARFYGCLFNTVEVV